MPICQFIVSFKIFITCFVKELVKKPIMRNRISTQLSEDLKDLNPNRYRKEVVNLGGF